MDTPADDDGGMLALAPALVSADGAAMDWLVDGDPAGGDDVAPHPVSAASPTAATTHTNPVFLYMTDS
ncbi:hypothetical protein [Arthrobacter sp. A5]|uniref:hypothetical protein n=1 Tax=Arthrobacter sp. A5 TaxID=576926 RepID=UPI003DA87962